MEDVVVGQWKFIHGEPKPPSGDVSLRRLVLSRDADHPTDNETKYAVKVSCLADFASAPVDWLWGHVLPLGSVTMLTGDASVGKTFFATDVAAEVTTGQGTSGQCRTQEPGNVLLISSEDRLNDVAGPRLKRAGADLSRIHALRGVTRRNPKSGDQKCWSFQLQDDLRLLELEIARQKAENSPLRLIIIDPFPAELFTGPQGSAKLIPTIKHLAEIAAWSQTAILLVATTPADRQAASSNKLRDLESAVQSAWTIVKDFDNPERRLLLPVKSNLAENPSGLSFKVQDNGLVWESNPACPTAEAYRAESLARTRDPLYPLECSELARAADWLRQTLNSKPLPLQTVRKEAAANDISYRTLHRAFCSLRGIARQIDNSRLWEWGLPPGTVAIESRAGEQ